MEFKEDTIDSNDEKLHGKASTILVIDDNLSDRTLVNAIIKKQRFSSLTAENGNFGIGMALDNDVDMIILDLKMPGLPGLEVLERIRSRKKYKKIPILIISARNDLRIVEKAIKLGADDFIVKPIDPDVFEKKLIQLADGKLTRWFEYDLPKYSDINKSLLGTEIELIQINQLGIFFESKLAFEIGSPMSVSTGIFSKMKVGTIKIVVDSCESKFRGRNDEEEYFQIRGSFVGLSEIQAQRIRGFCYSELWVKMQRT